MKADRKTVYDWVQDAVEAYRSENSDFPPVVLRPEGVREDGDWFYVTVARERPYISRRSFPFFDQLRDIEDKLEEEHQVKVLLVPTVAA